MTMIDFRQEDERSRRAVRCVGVYRGDKRMGQIDAQLNGACTFRNGGYQQTFPGMKWAQEFVKKRYEPGYQPEAKIHLSPEECLELEREIRQRIGAIGHLEVAANVTIDEVIEAGLKVMFPYADNHRPMMERVKRVAATTVMRSCGVSVPQVFDRRAHNNPLLPEGMAAQARRNAPPSIMPDARPDRVVASIGDAEPTLEDALAEAAAQLRSVQAPQRARPLLTLPAQQPVEIPAPPPPQPPEPEVPEPKREPEPVIHHADHDMHPDYFDLLPVAAAPEPKPAKRLGRPPKPRPVLDPDSVIKRRGPGRPPGSRKASEPTPPAETADQRRRRLATEEYERTRANLFASGPARRGPADMTEADCAEVRKRLWAGEVVCDVADAMNISRQLVGRIRTGTFKPKR